MRADSLVIESPGQLLREVRGFGKAWLGGTVDSTTKERDWMRGDEVIAEFDSIPASDTTSRPQANRIVATGDASSFYQLTPSRTVRSALNLNYVRGRVIEVLFADKAVASVNVTDQASGVYLEPAAEGAQPAAVPGAVRPARPAPASPQPPGGARRETP